jgi:periplasmic protein TonB
MYALDDEPEKKGRWQRLGMGALLAVMIGGGFIYAAKKVVPHSKLLQSVMKIAIVDYTPPKPRPREELPPPPKPLPPKPKPKEAPAKDAPKEAAPPEAQQNPKPDSNEPDIGLDSSSFGSGSGGPSFHQGSSMMGAPTGGKGGGGPALADAPKGPAAKIIEARPHATNKQPSYPEKVRRLAIEGLMVVEAEIDAEGRVMRASVRKPLEPTLDEEARKAVLGWSFDPATLAGKPVASTKLLRIRFQLE